jgi:ribonuclease D
LKPEKTDALPNHRNWINKFPEADRRLKLAKAALIELSEKNLVPLENLLTPEILRQVSFTPPEELNPESIAQKLQQLGARSWQTQLTSGAITEAFSLAEKVPDDQTEAVPRASGEHEAL